jgi:sugar phosphate isomerase/epimerase
MWSSFFVEDEPEAMLAKLAACGYRHTELSFEHAQALLKRPGPVARTAAAFAACADGHGIAIPQAHLSFCYDPLAVDPARRAADLDSLRREIELYILLGVKAAVLHVGGSLAAKAGWTETQIDDVRTASLQTLVAAAAGSGLRLALENLRHDLRDAAALLRVIGLSGRRESLGICLDTGHLNLTGGDPAAFVREAGDALIALHLADNLGEHDDHLFPFSGRIVWGPFLDALRASRYKGLANLEVPGERIFEAAFPAKPAILMHKARVGHELVRLMLGAD